MIMEGCENCCSSVYSNLANRQREKNNGEKTSIDPLLIITSPYLYILFRWQIRIIVPNARHFKTLFLSIRWLVNVHEIKRLSSLTKHHHNNFYSYNRRNPKTQESVLNSSVVMGKEKHFRDIHNVAIWMLYITNAV